MYIKNQFFFHHRKLQKYFLDVAKNVQNALTGAVESMAGVKVNVVNVNVCGIAR